MRFAVKVVLLASIGGPSLLACGSVAAQESADGQVPEQEIERGAMIVVTARKREENLIEVPAPGDGGHRRTARSRPDL